MDSIYFSQGVISATSGGVIIWYKGRLQQSNSGAWIFRSISQDGTIIAAELGPSQDTCKSSETPANGIKIIIPITIPAEGPNPVQVGWLYLQQQLPQELTN
jgi:hypothetical protein